MVGNAKLKENTLKCINCHSVMFSNLLAILVDLYLAINFRFTGIPVSRPN